ncbi:MAG: CinA family protein, partial [Firmicutes bacterium]|nr:CinA family protein [Bacillota bacterium]
GSDTPVGTVYIGVCLRGETKVFYHFFRRNNREFVRTGAVSWMFRDIYSILLN